MMVPARGESRENPRNASSIVSGNPDLSFFFRIGEAVKPDRVPPGDLPGVFKSGQPPEGLPDEG